MRNVCLMLFAISCRTTKVVTDPDLNTEYNNENEEGEDQEQTDDSVNPSDSNSNTVINDGVWLLTESTLVDDPCNFLEEIPKFGDGVVSVSLEDLLPESFDIQSMTESFKIKAKSYQARDFIKCEVESASFSCETQTAAAARYFFDGFMYHIDFTGTVIDSNTIQGMATVNYTIDENDDWWEDFLDNYDVDVTLCPQTLDLRMEYIE